MSFSPDGRYIVYGTRSREGAEVRDIFLLSIDGSLDVPLVQHPADDYVLGWAPDGKSILFVSDRTGNKGIWTISVAEGKPLGVPKLVRPNVGNIEAMGFARNGTFYYGQPSAQRAYSNSDIYTVPFDPDTGKILSPPTLVTQRNSGSNYSPTWSPDGKQLAFVSSWQLANGQMSRHLYIKSLQTSEEREIKLLPSQGGAPRWSPDGRYIALVKENRLGLYKIDTQTGDATPLVSNDPETRTFNPNWSADGKTIFFVKLKASETSIFVHDLESGQQKVLYDPGKGAFIQPSLSTSPDGQWLIFVIRSSLSTRVLIMSSSGGEPRELFRADYPVAIQHTFGVTWSHDGRHVFFAKRVEDKAPYELWRISVEGGAPQKTGLMMEDLRDLRIHPDGRQIAFSSGRIDNWEIWAMENFLSAAQSRRLSVSRR
jgi:Tol biopolymer transport system component